MKYTRESLIELLETESREFLPFAGHRVTKEITETCLSQFYPCKFVVNGVLYSSAEQFMHAEKARLFKDEEMLQWILATDEPLAAKRFGRSVQGFDAKVWGENKDNIVVQGNVAKFSQNPELKAFLLATGDKVIVEAAPRDTIWAIGYGMKSEHIPYPTEWRGENRLGFDLMEARDIIRNNL